MPVAAGGEFQLFVMVAAVVWRQMKSEVDEAKVAEQQMEELEIHLEFERVGGQKWDLLGGYQNPWDAVVSVGESEVLTEAECSR